MVVVRIVRIWFIVEVSLSVNRVIVRVRLMVMIKVSGIG